MIENRTQITQHGINSEEFVHAPLHDDASTPHRTKVNQPALNGEDRVESELCEKHNWQGTRLRLLPTSRPWGTPLSIKSFRRRRPARTPALARVSQRIHVARRNYVLMSEKPRASTRRRQALSCESGLVSRMA